VYPVRISFHQALRYIAALLAAIFVLTSFPVASLQAQDGANLSGLYDDADVFSDDETAEIEAAIDRVESAGAPTVVYLRLLHTEDDQAIEDAQRLMEEWDVQSSPDARDGVVLFFNLEPDDRNRGEFGIVAGEAHYDGGALPQSRLNTIRDEMIDLLADDRMAEAIVLGLDMTADYLESGPPEPTPLERGLDRIATGPISLLNVLAVLVAGGLGTIGWRIWRDRPRAGFVYQETTTQPPADTHPAIAGALVRGNVDASQVEALMLDLARNGAIALEPDSSDSKKVRVRILNQRRTFNEWEIELLRILVEAADDEMVLDQSDLEKTHAKWVEVQTLIRKDLEDSGLFDPGVDGKRAPLWIAGIVAILLGAIAGFLPVIVIDEAWSMVGGAVLGILGLVLIGMASSYPRTTADGERAAIPWRGYAKGLKETAKQDYGSVDLDEAFPYIVSMGLTDHFNKHLKNASEVGYVPVWILANEHQHQALAGHWFIYWGAFHTSMHHTPSGGGATGAGGAAAGSGGAGGRF
jgi:uncharacterized membrane protein YgcG